MFIINFILIFFGLGFLAFGLFFIGLVTKGDMYIFTDPDNPEERSKIFKTLKLGIILASIGTILLKIYINFLH